MSYFILRPQVNDQTTRKTSSVKVCRTNSAENSILLDLLTGSQKAGDSAVTSTQVHGLSSLGSSTPNSPEYINSPDSLVSDEELMDIMSYLNDDTGLVSVSTINLNQTLDTFL